MRLQSMVGAAPLTAVCFLALSLRGPSAEVIQAAMWTGFGRLPNQLLRIASRTNEPTPGEN